MIQNFLDLLLDLAEEEEQGRKGRVEPKELEKGGGEGRWQGELQKMPDTVGVLKGRSLNWGTLPFSYLPPWGNRETWLINC